MANTTGEKELKTNWPIEEGLTAETQKQTGRQTDLIAEESSLIPERLKEGIE
jgi:hypothetical protein|tara:strand:+ start:524 stop:679 length:156 start_codon:yes stop_codon:yes gene_type:complete